MSKEEIEKLTYIQPQTVCYTNQSCKTNNINSIIFAFQIGAARRIPGIKPSSILKLLYFIKSPNRNTAVN